jgi:hypothetical protein
VKAKGGPTTPGTDAMLLKIFFVKKLTKEMAFFAQTATMFSKNDHNIGF